VKGALSEVKNIRLSRPEFCSPNSEGFSAYLCYLACYDQEHPGLIIQIAAMTAYASMALWLGG